MIEQKLIRHSPAGKPTLWSLIKKEKETCCVIDLIDTFRENIHKTSDILSP